MALAINVGFLYEVTNIYSIHFNSSVGKPIFTCRHPSTAVTRVSRWHACNSRLAHTCHRPLARSLTHSAVPLILAQLGRVSLTPPLPCSGPPFQPGHRPLAGSLACMQLSSRAHICHRPLARSLTHSAAPLLLAHREGSLTPPLPCGGLPLQPGHRLARRAARHTARDRTHVRPLRDPTHPRPAHCYSALHWPSVHTACRLITLAGSFSRTLGCIGCTSEGT